MQHHSSFVSKMPGEVSVPDTEQYILKSESVGKDYKIFVASPPEWLGRQKNYPVLYLLDANQGFMATTDIVRLLQSTQELPPMLIVGIGYDKGDMLTLATRRTQELTPSPFPEYLGLWGLKSKGGDAGKFLSFITDELKPFIASQYPVNPDDSTLTGASLGGLFALYALFHQPDVFQRYVIGSPAIFWDKGILWQYQQQFAEKFQQLNINAFISVGGNEDTEPYHFPEPKPTLLSEVSLVDDTQKMVETLKQHIHKGFKLHSHVFEDETHMSVIGPWLSRGLRTVFNDTSSTPT